MRNFKNCYCQGRGGGGGGQGGEYNFHTVVTLGKGKDLTHHTFLKTSAPHWDVINERTNGP